MIGRRLTADSNPAEVIGVMPEGFRFLDMEPAAEVIIADHPQSQPRHPRRLQLLRARATQAWRDRCRRQRRHRPDAADLAQRLADTAQYGGRQVLENWRITPAVQPLKDEVDRRRRRHALGPDGDDRHGAAHRVRQRRQSDAGEVRKPASGVRRADGARRGPRTHRERGAGREPGALAHRRAPWAWRSRTPASRWSWRRRRPRCRASRRSRSIPARWRLPSRVSLVSSVLFGALPA